MRKEGKKVPSLFPKNAFFYTVIVHNVLTIKVRLYFFFAFENRGGEPQIF